MRLIFVISSLSSGGAERVLSILANYFAEDKDYEVVIVTIAKSDSFYSLHKNVKHIKLGLLKKSNNFLQSILNSFERIKALVQIFKEENPDIIISFMTHTNILSTIAAKIVRKKIIISERIAYDYHKSKVLNILRRLIYPLSNGFVTQTYSDLKNYAFLKHPCVIYNPVKFESFDANIKKQKIVLGVGRLEKQKGFDILIKAFHKVGRDDWKLVIAGDGSEREKLEKLIKELRAANIELIGTTKDIFEWYKRASIFVLSSNREGFPNVLIEAMSMGCAVVSFDCPYGPGEIIKDGVNGLLIENQNSQALETAIKRLIEDQGLRERLSSEAVKVREIYNIKNIASKWKKIIKEVYER